MIPAQSPAKQQIDPAVAKLGKGFVSSTAKVKKHRVRSRNHALQTHKLSKASARYDTMTFTTSGHRLTTSPVSMSRCEFDGRHVSQTSGFKT